MKVWCASTGAHQNELLFIPLLPTISTRPVSSKWQLSYLIRNTDAALVRNPF